MDRGRLVRFRAAARTQHTIHLDNLMEAVRKCLHRDVVLALKEKVVRQFEKVDQRHNRLTSILFTAIPEELIQEQCWYRHVSDNHRAALNEVDVYLSNCRQDPPASRQSNGSAASRSSQSSHARVLEAERRVQEESLKLQQEQEELRLQEEEDNRLVSLEAEKRRIERDRRLREGSNRLSQALLSQQVLQQHLVEERLSEFDQEETPESYGGFDYSSFAGHQGLLDGSRQQQSVTPHDDTLFTPSRQSFGSFLTGARSRFRSAVSALTPSRKQSSVSEKNGVRARIFNSTDRSSLGATGAQAPVQPSSSVGLVATGAQASVQSSSSVGLVATGAQASVQSSSSIGLVATGAQASVQSSTSVGFVATGAQVTSSSSINPNLVAFGAQVPVCSATQFPQPQQTSQSPSFDGGSGGVGLQQSRLSSGANRVVPNTLLSLRPRTYTAPALSSQPVSSIRTQHYGVSSAGHRLNPMAPSFASGAAGYRPQPVNSSASLFHPSAHNPSSSS